MYGLTIRSVFGFLRHTRREPFFVWIAFLVWSVFICGVLAVFAIEYDLLPHTLEPSITHGRPLIEENSAQGFNPGKHPIKRFALKGREIT
jgi:hypothetical protein